METWANFKRDTSFQRSVMVHYYYYFLKNKYLLLVCNTLLATGITACTYLSVVRYLLCFALFPHLIHIR